MKAIQVGLLGIGTVGSGVFNVLKRNQEEIKRRAGRGIEITMVADLDILAAAKRVQPDLYGNLVGQIVTNDRYGAVFEQGSRLRARVNSALQSLVRAGVVARLATKWFGIGWDKVTVLG